MSVETRGRLEWDGDDGYVEEKPATAPFGYLLTLDMYGCNPHHLGDLRRVYAFLDALVAALKMTKQAPPFVFLSPPNYPDKAGISGWVPLIESGIQVHTLQPRGFVSVDIYCCRKINPAQAREIAQVFFGWQYIEVNEIVRGTKYHRGER